MTEEEGSWDTTVEEGLISEGSCFLGALDQLEDGAFYAAAPVEGDEGWCIVFAHAHGEDVIVSVDNTMMSPLLQRPLELGIDVVCHSATKFICGHSDTMAGVVICKEEKLAKEIYFYQNAEGSALGPFDCWLLLRGVKTMGIRVYKQQENAMRIAQFLEDHPLVTKYRAEQDEKTKARLANLSKQRRENAEHDKQKIVKKKERMVSVLVERNGGLVNLRAG